MNITKDQILNVSIELLNQNGLEGFSMKGVAEKLGIRTPSLYNHVRSQEDLLRDIAHDGMRSMNKRMMVEAFGYAGVEALKKAGQAYFEELIEKPGVYEAVQWANWHGTEETEQIFSEYLNILTRLIAGCGVQEETEKKRFLILWKSFFHGYGTMELRRGIMEPEEVIEELKGLIELLYHGMLNHVDKK